MRRIGLVGLVGLLASVAGCFSKPRFVERDAAPGDAVDASDATTDGGPQRQLTFTKLSTGALHACAIDTDTRLWCWGDNSAQQLASADPPMTPTPQLVAPDTGWTDVAAGARHTCGIRDAQVYCWGDNARQQSAPMGAMGLVGITPVTLPATPATAVFVGSETSCAVAGNSKQLYCWGNVSLDGMLEGPSLSPHADVLDVAFGTEHACLITATETRCWGSNVVGQHGTDMLGGRVAFTAAAKSTAPPLVDIAAGDEATCGIGAADLKLYCWGSNARGHMRNAVQTQTGTPTVIDPATSYAQVVMGQAFTCLRSGATVACHGDSGDGALGNGTFAGSRIPTSPALQTAMTLAAGERYACAIDDAQHLACWGSNKRGELAIGSIASKRSPVRAMLPAGQYEDVVVGEDHTCALANDGTTFCWGSNTSAQVTGTIGAVERVPVAGPASSLNRLAAGAYHTCGIGSGGTLACWGANDYSQLGDMDGAGSNEIATSPTGSAWSAVAASLTGTCGIDLMNRLTCWGLLPGVSEPQLPTLVDTATYRLLAMGDFASIAIRGDNTLRGFGSPCPLALSGQGELAPTVAITVVANVTGPAVIAIAKGGGFHTCMHYTSGAVTLRCWGDNSANQVGATAQCTASEVKTIGTGLATPDEAIATVATGTAHSCAIDKDGSLFCWGQNTNDTLGTLTADGTPRAVPVGALRFSEIATSRTHTCAITRDRNDVYCWGENRVGQLGDGTSFEAAAVPAAFDPR